MMCSSQIMKKIMSFPLSLFYIWKPSIQNILPWARFNLYSFKMGKEQLTSLGSSNNVITVGPDFINDQN